MERTSHSKGNGDETPIRIIVVLDGERLLVEAGSCEYLLSRSQLPSGFLCEALHFKLTPSLTLYLCSTASLACDQLEWRSLRSCLGNIDQAAFQVASRAVQTSRWLIEHQYCGKCGGKTVLADDEPSLDCQQCQLNFYPRISPCVIGLIIRGNHCLLARGDRLPEGMFSTLAGFIEVGENAEQAFAREVEEEVGLVVHNLRYAGSQAWPFPGQLMFGFIAEHKAGDIRIDEKEILEADWFHYSDLPLIPPESTISGQLIRRFVKDKTNQAVS